MSLHCCAAVVGSGVVDKLKKWSEERCLEEDSTSEPRNLKWQHRVGPVCRASQSDASAGDPWSQCRGGLEPPRALTPAFLAFIRG